ncbi:MAG: isoleucine--tRNA ligase [Clostridia bacterium]
MFDKVDSKFNFLDEENSVINFWKENAVFEKTVSQNEGKPSFSFFDGPPTANGIPHIGHILTRSIKDIFPRFKTMKGFYVTRKAGWDTHGLPVELEVEKQLGIDGKKEIEKYGIEPFVKKCKESVWKYKGMWESLSERVGYWVDMKNPYITYTNDYIESEWWALSEMFKKGLIYQGYKIVPYCPRCGTALSSHEVAQGYKDVKDVSVFVKFPVLGEEKTYFLAWTTTPWTLPSNVALCVNPKEEYVLVESKGEKFWLAKALSHKILPEGIIIKTVIGKDLEKSKYVPLFDFAGEQKNAYFITCDNYVTLSDGTGIVHIAPAFGEDDSSVGKKYNLPFVQLVGPDGKFVDGTRRYTGMPVKKANPIVIEDLKERENNLIFAELPFEHSYPHCWRCDTPLLYYARSSWFIKTTSLRDNLVANNRSVNWLPDNVKEGRMGNFLENNIDWGISRERYWGTPLPFWICDECHNIECIGSKKELMERAGLKEEIELHKPYIDSVEIKCSKCGKTMHRTPEVMDCWFDSGSMPFASIHYPFEHKEEFERTFPADFISEGIDQTRGWFYSLQAISTLLFDKSPYKTCIALGLVNDKFGMKMSKSKGNVVDPWKILNNQGADALRWYFYIANSPWLGTSFSEENLGEYQRKFMGTLWNTYSFFVLYANIDGFNPKEHSIDKVNLSMMDKWLLSKFNSLVKFVDDKLENFLITESARKIVEFVDELSNWYIRRSRERFWVGGMAEDKTSAFTTLYYVLEGLTKLIAPFVPFISETIYQNLVRSFDKDAPISVHLCSYPKCDEKIIDEKLEDGMEEVLSIVALGRAARATSQIKNRQPLSTMIIGSILPFHMSEELITIIKDELNVEKVEFVKNASSYITYTLKPQLKTIGPKYGKLLGGIKEWLTSCDSSKVVAELTKGEKVTFEVSNEKIEITNEDVLISVSSKEGYSGQSNEDITVVLDIRLSDELVQKGNVREIISKIQALRKEKQFEIADHINIEIFSENSELNASFNKFANLIGSGTLADSVVVSKEKQDCFDELDINGTKCFVKLINRRTK